MDQYLVLKYEDLETQSRILDLPYLELERQLDQATSTGGFCVYFRRYTSWQWIIISEKVPVDWLMALVLA